MKNKFLIVLILSGLMFCISCKQNIKKDQPIIVNDKTTIREWAKPIHKPLKPDFIKKPSYIVIDPYKEIWTKDNLFLGRFYLDITKDGIPEIFIKWKEEKGISSYVIYKLVKLNYLFLGYFSFNNLQLMESNHFGCQDLMIFMGKETVELGKDEGFLQVYQFNGVSYECVKEMEIGLNEAIQEKIFVPDETVAVTYHPMSNKLQWSPKDDDKYRRMIK